MKNKILIETAEEFIKFSNPNRISGDNTPFLNPGMVTLTITHYQNLYLEDKENKFILDTDITFQDLVKAMIEELRLNVKFEGSKLE